MKVLFDYQIFSLQKYGGISRYFANLHYGIKADSAITSEIGLIFTDNAYVNDQNSVVKLLSKSVIDDAKRYKYNKWYCRYLINNNKFDILHPTFYNPYFLKYLKKPFVLTVHDMINERFPHFYKNDPAASFKKELIKRASHIIAVSEFTKKDMQEFYAISDDNISVIHHGFKMQGLGGQPKKNSENLEVITGDYLLYAGDRYAYKNFLFFVDAIAPLLKRYSVKLICAGGKAFNNTELLAFKKSGIKDRVVRIEADDTLLSQLYQNALAFIYPSLYEGFGLPILEAFHNNCPVILSDKTALPEVAGYAAEYFNPIDSVSIASVTESVITNPQKRQRLKASGRQRLQLFTFENCLKKTLEVYTRL